MTLGHSYALLFYSKNIVLYFLIFYFINAWDMTVDIRVFKIATTDIVFPMFSMKEILKYCSFVVKFFNSTLLFIRTCDY